MKFALSATIATAIAASSVLLANPVFSSESLLSSSEHCTPADQLTQTPTTKSTPRSQRCRRVQSSSTLAFKNSCSSPFRLAIHFMNLSGNWETRAWYTFVPGESARLNGVQTKNRYFYFYAEATDGSGVEWSGGDTTKTINGQDYGMKMVDTGSRVVNWTQDLTCR